MVDRSAVGAGVNSIWRTNDRGHNMKKLISVEIPVDDCTRELRRLEYVERRRLPEWVAGGTMSRDDAIRRLARLSAIRGLVEASFEPGRTVTVEIEEI
jgi:hypothetical protein